MHRVTCALLMNKGTIAGAAGRAGVPPSWMSLTWLINAILHRRPYSVFGPIRQVHMVQGPGRHRTPVVQQFLKHSPLAEVYRIRVY